MIDYFIEATDTDGRLIKRKIIASSKKEAEEMFLTSCRWNIPDTKFKKVIITTGDIRRKLERNG